MYKIVLDDSKWEIIETNTFEKVDLNTFDISLNPIQNKLFNHDVFDINDSTITIIHSPTRMNKYNAGILDLSKTYGKDKKCLYLCRPDDKRLPSFLIPYEIPPSFEKMKKQLYITFEFKKWEEHPMGIITQNLGPVDIPENYYEYMLYCKSLNISIQPFTKDVLKVLKQQTQKDIMQQICKKYNIQERKERVFTIDSKQSIDRDDGLSISNGQVSVYIAYVPIILDYLNLWNSFTNRISTIYLPDKKRSMLPSVLSQLCSLEEGEERICFIMDIIDGTYTFSLGKVKIHKNYCYEDESLIKDKDYIALKDYFKTKNSHDLIENAMILLNQECTKEIKRFKNGIYKYITNMDFETNNPYLLESRHKMSCYSPYQEICEYAQFTSPIRRLVDILNLIQISFNKNIMYFEKGVEFYEDWYQKMDYMNVSMRHIRKVQTKCKLLDTFIHEQHKVFQGFVFDKIVRSDEKYKYNVYIPELKMNTSITIQNDLEEQSEHSFKVYVFQNEGELKKKIKLQIC
jgi:exoribonuclease R